MIQDSPKSPRTTTRDKPHVISAEGTSSQVSKKILNFEPWWKLDREISYCADWDDITGIMPFNSSLTPCLSERTNPTFNPDYPSISSATFQLHSSSTWLKASEHRKCLPKTTTKGSVCLRHFEISPAVLSDLKAAIFGACESRRVGRRECWKPAGNPRWWDLNLSGTTLQDFLPCSFWFMFYTYQQGRVLTDWECLKHLFLFFIFAFFSGASWIDVVWYTNACLTPCFVKQILSKRMKPEYIALYITLCWLWCNMVLFLRNKRSVLLPVSPGQRSARREKRSNVL